MDSRGVLARFDAERQALALMDHPNIARIYDGGVTPARQPFFVMELVQGVPLTQYCDQRRLTVTARLELFVAVCQAVQHAHQKGIIHRDLKPGNVLVTEVDGRATPKVIDFGVAKATEVSLTDMSLADLGAIVGTPTYMSPEQADPSSMDIDTRTDVYALGVMLYELLTGSPPIDAKQFQRGAILEMLRMVREVDPPRPSTKLSTAEALPNIAANRSIEPARLSKLLEGELDWVVMKALEKDRNRRYDTANGFARDVQRYLADEVVEARPPSRGYRLKKFVKRNRIQVIAASLLFLTLVGGIVGTSVGMASARRAQKAEATQRGIADGQRDKAIAAERQTAIERDKALAAERQTAIERDRALSAEAKTKTINEFLTNDLLSQAEPENNAVEDKVTLLEVLDRAAEKVGTRFENQPELEVELRATISKTYHGLASWEKAETQARAMLDAARKRDPRSVEAYLAQGELVHILRHRGRRDAEVIEMAEAAARGVERLRAPDDPATLSMLQHLAAAYRDVGRAPEAIALLERVRDAKIAKLGPDQPYQPDTLTTLHNLGEAYSDAGRFSEAITLLERCRDTRITKLGPNDPRTLSTLGGLSSAYLVVGRLRESIALFERVRDAQVARLGPDHSVTLTTLNNLAEAYQAAGKFNEAIAVLERVRDVRIATLPPDHPHTLTVLSNLAAAYRSVGRLPEATALFERIRDARIAKLGPDHPETLTALNNVAAAYYSANRLDKSVPLFEDLLKRREAKLGRPHPDTLMTMANLGANYVAAGRLKEAIPLLEEAYRASGNIGELRWVAEGLASAYLVTGKLPEAIALYERARDSQIATLGPDHPETLSTLNNLATAYWSAKQLDKSVPLFEDVLKRSMAKLGRQHLDTLKAMANLGVNYRDSGRLKEAIPLLEEAHQAGKGYADLRWVASALIDVYTQAGEKTKLADLLQEQLLEARKALPKDSPQLAGLLAQIGLSLLKQSNWTDAEPLLRESLAIREQKEPEDWRTFNTKSLLGGALLGQKKYAEAEPLLLAGYEGMKQREKTIPPQGVARLPEALDRLIELSTATNQPEEVKKWQAERAKYPEAAPPHEEKK
jgi:tetratricopeptide (TPR) repeat protein